MVSAKVQDLAGPGIGDYDELERILPADYASRLKPKVLKEMCARKNIHVLE